MGHDYSKFWKKFGTDAVSYKWKLSVYFKFIFDKGARGQYNGLVDYITASETKSDHKIEVHVLITHVFSNLAFKMYWRLDIPRRRPNISY